MSRIGFRGGGAAGWDLVNMLTHSRAAAPPRIGTATSARFIDHFLP